MVANFQVPPALPGFDGISRSWVADLERPCARIMPGEFYVTPHDEVLSTTLGSCISACIRDPKLNIGGMNHFMLPSTNETPSTGVDSTMYGGYAMERLVNEIVKHGAKRSDIEVKIVGGGQMIASKADIGQGNIGFVFEYLRVEGLTVTSQDLGGTSPRRVLYYPRTGRLRVRKLPAVDRAAVERKERDYMDRVSEQTAPGAVELF